MATIDLGKIKMVWRGAYDNATAYTIDDAVSLNGTSYICIAATTGNTPPNATYWNVLAQGGTDLGTTLSNNQIAIKNNSGNIAGVNIGNAGEFLKVSSGATGYEFGAVSSDYVRLLTSDYSTAVNSVNLDNIFSSTYRGYKVLLEDPRSTGNNFGELQLRFLDTSGSEINGSYYIMNCGGQYHTAGNSAGAINGYDNNRSSARLGNWNMATSNEQYPCIWELTFGQMHLNKEHSFIFTGKLFDANGNYDAAVIGGARYAQSSATRGINLQINGGHNFSSYRMTVWGLK